MRRHQALRAARLGLDPSKFEVQAHRSGGACRIVITRRSDLARLCVASAATWLQADAQRRSGFREVDRYPIKEDPDGN